jgi:competence ComEA-like helix-hairpin-helix protein
MVSSSDRRAALLLLGVAVLGAGVRLVAGGSAPGAVAYRFREPSPTRDSVAAAAAVVGRPLGADEKVDVDRAPASELTRLPRVGPALAARIVADREARGPFGSLDGLGRVPGVGAGTAAGLRGHVTFSGQARARPKSTPPGGDPVSVNTATAEELATLPGIGPRLAAAIVADRERNGPFRAVADLQRVRGIGPVLVTRLTGRIRIP